MELIDKKKVGAYGTAFKIAGIIGFPVVAIGLVILFVIFIVIITFSSNSSKDAKQFAGQGTAQVSEAVKRYEPLLMQFAKEEGVESYVPVMEALMMQESGGNGGDPMQSSESQGYDPGYFKDPVTSIKFGVKHFKDVITKTNGDVKLALQSYNFGSGFIDFVMARGGKYTEELAREFSSKEGKKLGWSCSSWQEPGMCYGDVNYVKHVLRYFNGNVDGDGAPLASNAPKGGQSTDKSNAYGFIYPVSNHEVTSPFDMRSDPFTGAPKFHKGADLSCGKEEVPVYAAKSGTVTRASWENAANPKQGYGQIIQVDHGGGVSTAYAHLSKMIVKPGDVVQQGQQIANCGSTGSSTGLHVHFEVRLDNKQVEPMQYLK